MSSKSESTIHSPAYSWFCCGDSWRRLGYDNVENILYRACAHDVHAGRQTNRPFPSSKKSHFQNEAKCETFFVKMSFICVLIKNHFHINGFALSLALKFSTPRTLKKFLMVKKALLSKRFDFHRQMTKINELLALSSIFF